MSFETPIGKVRGLGSAKAGTEHFFNQRLTALANLPLTIAVLVIGIMAWGQPHEAVVALLQNPFVAILLGLFVINSALHMRLGMQVLIEDYVHKEGAKILLLVANTMFCALIGIVAIYAILKINFGVAA